MIGIKYHLPVSYVNNPVEWFTSFFDATEYQNRTNDEYGKLRLQYYLGERNELPSRNDIVPKDTSKNDAVQLRATYNRGNAAWYANTYWNVCNRNYIIIPETNCANFVSQCLKAGGFSNLGTNKNADNNWFYYSSSNYSQTWSTANGLRRLK